MIKSVSQLTLALRVAMTGLPRRLGSSLVIVSSVACTIGVLVSILALATGLEQAYTRGGSDSIAIVTGYDAAFQSSSSLSRGDVLAVRDAPGIARSRAGSVEAILASAELRTQLPPVPRAADGSIQVRGIEPTGIDPALRPNFRIVSGRMFRPGAQELIIGTGIARAHGKDMAGSILMPDGEWPIVGTFTNGGSIEESDLMGDADTLLSSLKRSGYTRVLVALQNPAAFARFASWIKDSPGLRVSVERQPDYLRRMGGEESRYFTALAFVIGGVMALGALFSCVKILYASVSVRSQEMAILRAMGYARLPVAASVIAEGLVLSVLGALLGGGMAWMAFDGRHAADYSNTFTMAVTPALLLAGVGWAALLAIVGGIVPALRAARLDVIAVLRGN